MSGALRPAHPPRYFVINTKATTASKFATCFLINFGALMAGLYFVVLPVLGHGKTIPGDLCDARFNMYILEHGYQWMTGKVAHFWDGKIFYPFPLTMAFSDNLLGSVPIYTALRAYGFDREFSFQAWYLMGFIVNYFASVYVLFRIGLSSLAVAVASFIFTFALPVTAQEGHAQLLYRFGVPLAVYCLWRFHECPKLGYLFGVIFWFVWQLYVDIYIGYFLGLFLVSLTLIFPLQESRSVKFILTHWREKVVYAWSIAGTRERGLFSAANASVLCLLVWLLFPYIKVSCLYGFKHRWSDISSMLPRPMSYLLADDSLIWRSNLRIFNGIPMRWEHSIFIGLVPFVLFTTGVFFAAKKERNRLFHAMFWSLVCVFFLTLYLIGGVSLYYALFILPGFSAVGAVTRIILVMLFPIGVLAGAAVDSILSTLKPVSKIIVAALMLLLLISEAALVRHSSFKKADGLNRLEILKRSIHQPIDESSVLLVAVKPSEWILVELDAMLVAQELGIRTANGYSGNFPPGFEPISRCSQVGGLTQSYAKFSRRPRKEVISHFQKRIASVGFSDFPCDLSLGEAPRKPLMGTELLIDDLELDIAEKFFLFYDSKVGLRELPLRP
jgi:hypothetical protein